MDIEKLKLADREIRTIQNDLGHGWAYVGPEHVASAQLAKALWGLADQLLGNVGDPVAVGVQVMVALKSAGIPRPETKHSAAWVGDGDRDRFVPYSDDPEC